LTHKVTLSRGDWFASLPLSLFFNTTTEDYIMDISKEDWKPLAYLNRIKFAQHEPASPSEKAGLSPITVKRLMKDAEDQYYVGHPKNRVKPVLLVRDEETEGRWDRIVAHRMPNGGVRKLFYVGC
jgi:hypothetical protein